MDFLSLVGTLSLDSSQYEHALQRARTIGKEFTRQTNSDSDTMLGRAKQAIGAFSNLFPRLRKTVGQLPPAVENAQRGFTVLRGVISNLVSGGINLLASAIRNNLGGAISRLDTLKNYEIVMGNLGVESEDAKKSIDRLSNAIDGLPTTLPEIAKTQQQFKALGKTMEDSTDLTIALNNATLAGGQGQAVANSALQQWYQMIAAGKSDLMSMRIINEAMPAQMDAIAKSVVGANANWQDLHAEWQKNPEITKKVEQAILDLNEKGINGTAGFAQQAKDATKGIQTSITNIGTQIQKGLADVIDNAFGYRNVADKIEEFKETIKGGFKNLNFLIDTAQNEKFGIGYAIELGVEQAINALDKLYAAIPKILDKIADKVSKASKDIDIKGIIDKLIDVIVSRAPAILDKVGELLNQFAAWLAENGADIIIKFGEGFIKALPAIISFMGQVVNAILKVVVGLPVMLLARGLEAAGALALGILKKANAVATAGAKLVSNAVKGLKKLPSQFLAWAGKGISSLVSGFNKGVSKIKTAAGKLASGAVDKLKSGFNKVKDIGTNIVHGIGEGITNGTKWIKDKISSFVGNVKSFLKRLFGIKSPSKWARDNIGKMIDAGLALGISDNADMVDDAVDDLMPNIKMNSIDSFVDTNNNRPNTNKLVSPVVNMNVVVNGADDPEMWGDKLADEFIMRVRTA